MDFDVAIVGGGPAGCSTALALRKEGFNVAVIASSSNCVKPTETAVPALTQILNSLGAAAALRACEPCYGICSTWGTDEPSLQPAILNPHGNSWFIHRAEFDELLKCTAKHSGVHWIEARAESVRFDTSMVHVSTSDKTILANWLVFATGSAAWPARVTGQKVSRLDSLVAFWSRVPISLETRLLFVESTAAGWWYLCPDKNKGSIICLVTDPATARLNGVAQIHNWNEHFRATKISRQFQCEGTAECVHAISTGLSALPQKHGHRWIVVGDAAAKFDPLGSSGTITALVSGQKAATAIIESFQGNPLSFETYERWSSCRVEEFVRQRAEHYAMERRMGSDGFWGRRIKSRLLAA